MAQVQGDPRCSPPFASSSLTPFASPSCPGSGTSALGLPAGFTLDLASRVARQGAAFGVRRAVEDAFRPAGEDGGAGGGRYTARSRSSRWGKRRRDGDAGAEGGQQQVGVGAGVAGTERLANTRGGCALGA